MMPSLAAKTNAPCPILPRLLRKGGIAILFALLLAPLTQAQLPTAASTPAPATQPDSTDDPLGRSTPHGAVLGFVKAANKADWDTAAQYLDTRQKGALAGELAQQLKAVLDRANSIDLTKISRSPSGSQADPQKPNSELIGTTALPGGKLPLNIALDRIKRGDNPQVWLFSQDTLRQIPDAYDNLSGPSTFEQKLPAWLQKQFFATPLWRWFLFFAAIPLVLLLGSWLNRLFRPLMERIAHHVGGRAAIEKVRSIRAPLRLLFFGIFLLIFGSTAESLLGRSFWSRVGQTVTVIALTWLAMRTVGLISEMAVARLKRAQSTDTIALAGLLGRLSQIAALIIGALVILRMRGVDLTAVLTGLGIGGLAVAFAAQKTLENLFGGIMIISDQPFRIGDQCRVGSVDGNVIDIGLRSTRIRTFSRTIVNIPNGQLSTMNIENFSVRDKFWFHHIVTLKYDTTAAQMQTVLDAIRKLLEADERVETPTFRANFIAIGSVSDDIEISAYVFAGNYVGFLVVQEHLLLEILSIVESAGAEFSLPTQVTKVEGTVS